MLQLEQTFWDRGCGRLAGIDEAGRGPLAGPVVAAAVVMGRSLAERELHGIFEGLTDSKKLSAPARESFYEFLASCPGVEIGVGMAGPEEIDRINILRATHVAMARAVADLPFPPEHVIVDGRPVGGLPCASTSVVRGDASSLLIAAASIVAKVVRDARMLELDRLYPRYGFARHKGYGTSEHIQALLEYGPCPIHRRSFRPVAEALAITERRK